VTRFPKRQIDENGKKPMSGIVSVMNHEME